MTSKIKKPNEFKNISTVVIHPAGSESNSYLKISARPDPNLIL